MSQINFHHFQQFCATKSILCSLHLFPSPRILQELSRSPPSLDPMTNNSLGCISTNMSPPRSFWSLLSTFNVYLNTSGGSSLKAKSNGAKRAHDKKHTKETAREHLCTKTIAREKCTKLEGSFAQIAQPRSSGIVLLFLTTFCFRILCTLKTREFRGSEADQVQIHAHGTTRESKL